MSGKFYITMLFCVAVNVPCRGETTMSHFPENDDAANEKCSTHSNCNFPFGYCDENTRVCTCIFGFDGDHCYSPWLFVSLIVGGALFLSTITLSIILITRCSSTTSRESLRKEESPAKPNTRQNVAVEDNSNPQEAERSDYRRRNFPLPTNHSYHNRHYSDEDSYYSDMERNHAKESRRSEPMDFQEEARRSSRQKQQMDKVVREMEESHRRIKKAPSRRNRSHLNYSSDCDNYGRNSEKYYAEKEKTSQPSYLKVKNANSKKQGNKSRA